MLHSYFISTLQHKDRCKICCLGVITRDVQIVGIQFAWRRLLFVFDIICQQSYCNLPIIPYCL